MKTTLTISKYFATVLISGSLAVSLHAADNTTKAPAAGEKEKSLMTLKIMPVGDSNTRGTYFTNNMLPSPDCGGWRKLLQDKLRAAGVAFDFVGELNYGAYGQDGKVDPAFDPDHHGLAGFSNRDILEGGGVPTDPAVLAALGVTKINVPDIVTVLRKHQPNVILLMSGSNGFDEAARNKLILTILANFNGHLFVATIPPQRPPREGAGNVEAYNKSLPDFMRGLQATGHKIHLVDIFAVLTPDDLHTDGVHLGRTAMEKVAAAWYAALVMNGLVPGAKAE